MFNAEIVYQLLLDKNWIEIAKYLSKYANLVKSDPVLNNAIDLFEEEFFSNIKNSALSDASVLFKEIGVLVELHEKRFSSTFVNKFVDEKLNFMVSINDPNLLTYAIHNSKNLLAETIIEKTKASRPEDISDIIRPNVSINSSSLASCSSKTIRLFKSKQEDNFFQAMRRAFPTFHPYPNVALSCILDYNAIKNELNSIEQEYFFKAIIDSVVFDAADKYQPIYFFEIDSDFHDSDKARKKDKIKNKIFEVANVKLIRIRSHSQGENTVDKFESMILEIMRNLTKKSF